MPQRRAAAQPQAPAPVPAGRPAQPAGAMNLGQAAEQIGGLNLFGDDSQSGPSADDGSKTPRGRRATPEDDREHDDTSGDGQTDDSDVSADGADSGQPEGDEIDTGGEDQDEGESEGEQEANSGEDEQPALETLNDLASALEVEPDFFDNLELTFKADGQDVTVNLAELRQGYQRDANYRRQTQELADTRRQMEADHAQRLQHFEVQVVQLGQVLNQGEQLLVGELNTAEMQNLRKTNPAEWAARREELQNRINGVKQLYAYAAQQYDAYQTQQADKLRQQLTEIRRQELQNLQTAMPDFGDVRDKLVGYLDTSYGYAPEDLASVFDSRLIVIANKARLYDEMQAVGAKTKQKVAKLPKVQKPAKGAAKPKSGNVANIRKARSQLAKSGKVKDAAALIGLTLKDI